MPWKAMDVQDQRVQFVVWAHRQLKPFSALCSEFGISRPTAMSGWGVSGQGCRDRRTKRRPHRSPERTSEQLEARVVQLRLRYPDWGAGSFPCCWAGKGSDTQEYGAPDLVARDLVHAEDATTRRRCVLNESVRTKRQMDFKGPRGWRHPVGPLSVYR